MDLNQHLSHVIQGIIGEVTANVGNQIDSVISATINAKLASYDFSSYIRDAAATAIEHKISDYNIDPKKLENRIVEQINTTINQVQANTHILINQAISKEISATNFQSTLVSAVSTVVADRLQDYVFPTNSINPSAIKINELQISGDNVKGGLIENFSSTGIDDRATNVALTILDDVTVVENNLLTKDLTVEGQMTINGDFVVNGTVPADSPFFRELVDTASSTAVSKLDNTLFDSYSTIIFNKIKNEGLDLNRITINNNEVIKNNQLGSSITESNLQKLGLLKELQVSGETLLSESLYTSNKRVGINTIEPSGALAVWDDEVEVVIIKRQKDTGSFGTLRQQRLILSSNGQDNIVLNTDGSTQINELHMGQMKFTSSDQPPTYVSKKGHVVWNNNPNLGGPMGWICLGEARWANFGIID